MKLLAAALHAGFSPPILNMVAKVYVPVLFPLTFLLALCGMWIDRTLGFAGGFLSPPWHVGAAAVSFAAGTALWLVTYEQLTRIGEGSPSPTAGRTVRLVTTGIYAYCRNPSIYGKLLGVLAVGFLLNSFSFCVILCPLLLAGSLVEKVWRQEPQLVAIFGEDYERYRRDVPLFIPWKLFVPWKR